MREWYFTILDLFSVDRQLGDWFTYLLYVVYCQCGSWQRGRKSRNLLLLFVFRIKKKKSFSWMSFSDRSKETDWQPYFTTRLVDDFGTHLRVFRKAQQRIAEKGDQMKGNDLDIFLYLSLSRHVSYMCEI